MPPWRANSRHVAEALPRHDGGQVRRVQRGDRPLRHGEIRHAAHADPARAPRLDGSPFDQVVRVLRVLRRQPGGAAFRVPHPADVRVDDHIAVRHPEARVRRLERRVVGPAEGADVHAERPEQVVVAGGQSVLAVGRDRHHDRTASVLDRPEDVGHQVHAVTHGNRDVSIEPHAGHRLWVMGAPPLDLEPCHPNASGQQVQRPRLGHDSPLLVSCSRRNRTSNPSPRPAPPAGRDRRVSA